MIKMERDALRHTIVETVEALCGDGKMAYMSTPITTGLRSLSLAAAAARPDGKIDTAYYSKRWVKSVFEPNVAEAAERVKWVRHHARPLPVFNPACLMEPAAYWTEDTWGELWDEVLRRFVSRVYVAPGWPYSNGCRREVQFALQDGIPVHLAAPPWRLLLPETIEREAVQATNTYPEYPLFELKLEVPA